MNMHGILNYLTALEQNNTREWYHAHKPQFVEANQSFEAFIQSLMLELRKADNSLPLFEPKELTFKIMRDTRFSHDKSPYRPAFRAHIAPKGKLPIPVGSYIMIQPGNRSFLGGGLFADMFKDATSMVREHIAAHGARLEKIVSEPEFAAQFTVGGTTLKKVPRDYDPLHPQAEYLKKKSWYLEAPVTDEELLKPDFITYAVDTFVKMKPFNDFLNEALTDFQMPTR